MLYLQLYLQCAILFGVWRVPRLVKGDSPIWEPIYPVPDRRSEASAELGGRYPPRAKERRHREIPLREKWKSDFDERSDWGSKSTEESPIWEPIYPVPDSRFKSSVRVGGSYPKTRNNKRNRITPVHERWQSRPDPHEGSFDGEPSEDESPIWEPVYPVTESRSKAFRGHHAERKNSERDRDNSVHYKWASGFGSHDRSDWGSNSIEESPIWEPIYPDPEFDASAEFGRPFSRGKSNKLDIDIPGPYDWRSGFDSHVPDWDSNSIEEPPLWEPIYPDPDTRSKHSRGHEPRSNRKSNRRGRDRPARYKWSFGFNPHKWKSDVGSRWFFRYLGRPEKADDFEIKHRLERVPSGKRRQVKRKGARSYPNPINDRVVHNNRDPGGFHRKHSNPFRRPRKHNFAHGPDNFPSGGRRPPHAGPGFINKPAGPRGVPRPPGPSRPMRPTVNINTFPRKFNPPQRPHGPKPPPGGGGWPHQQNRPQASPWNRQGTSEQLGSDIDPRQMELLMSWFNPVGGIAPVMRSSSSAARPNAAPAVAPSLPAAPAAPAVPVPAIAGAAPAVGIARAAPVATAARSAAVARRASVAPSSTAPRVDVATVTERASRSRSTTSRASQTTPAVAPRTTTQTSSTTTTTKTSTDKTKGKVKTHTKTVTVYRTSSSSSPPKHKHKYKHKHGVTDRVSSPPSERYQSAFHPSSALILRHRKDPKGEHQWEPVPWPWAIGRLKWSSSLWSPKGGWISAGSPLAMWSPLHRPTYSPAISSEDSHTKTTSLGGGYTTRGVGRAHKERGVKKVVTFTPIEVYYSEHERATTTTTPLPFPTTVRTIDYTGGPPKWLLNVASRDSHHHTMSNLKQTKGRRTIAKGKRKYKENYANRYYGVEGVTRAPQTVPLKLHTKKGCNCNHTTMSKHDPSSSGGHILGKPSSRTLSQWVDVLMHVISNRDRRKHSTQSGQPKYE